MRWLAVWPWSFKDSADTPRTWIILVTRAALKQIHEALEGLGYVPPFTGSKHLRDAETGVKIEFLITGDYPRRR